MAKKSAVETNSRRRRMAATYKNRRAGLKAVARDRSVSMEERFAAQLKLARLPRNSAANRIRNRCELSGRPRGFYRKLKVSSIALRTLALDGAVPGMVKSSW